MGIPQQLGSVIAAAAIVGVATAQWTSVLSVESVVKTAHVNADVTACAALDPPGTVDPGGSKDVAWSECSLEDVDADGKFDTVDAAVFNAYPGYATSFLMSVHNGGTVPERISSVEIESPAEYLSVDYSDVVGIVLDPGESTVASASVLVLPAVSQSSTYRFKIRLDSTQWQTGTIGFWRAWDHNRSYARTQMESWLKSIDDTSAWLGPKTTAQMEATLKAGGSSGASARQRFLAHYLAMRLNAVSGRMSAGEPHDVRGADQSGYLNLGDPTACTLAEVVSAIEAKCSGPCTDAELILMKDVCDGINNRIF